MRIVLVLTVALAIAGSAAAAPRPALTGSHPCAGLSGYTCSTLSVPLDRSGRVSGSLRLNVAAADNVKRVVRGNPDSQSPWEIASFLELKTVWHPVGQ